MQSPTPSAAAARETASALEALLEIKHSPPSVLGTRTGTSPRTGSTPANQPPPPTAPLGVKGMANPTALAEKSSGNPNLQIPVTMPIAIAAQAHLRVHAAATAPEGASIRPSTGGGTLPRHILTPRHQQPHEKSFLPAGAHVAPHSTMHPPPSPVVLGTAEILIAPASAKMNAGAKNSSPGGATSATGTAPSTVREDEIQAALTSKPQRGRKRMNLTAEERKELTKTRNRDHARTTRIRKKARNDELLAIEAKYRDLMQKEELDQARRACVKEFFAIRTEMLARALSPTSNAVNNDDDTKAIVSTSSSLDKVIENQWLFEVSTLAPERTTENGIGPLHKFDENMANSIKSNYRASNVTYNLGTDSLAITNDSVIALAEIMDQLTQEIITTITVQFKFGPRLSKIRLLTWYIPPSLGNDKPIIGKHLQADHTATLPSIVSMHSVSSLGRTSPINGAVDGEQDTACTITRKLSE